MSEQVTRYIPSAKKNAIIARAGPIARFHPKERFREGYTKKNARRSRRLLALMSGERRCG